MQKPDLWKLVLAQLAPSKSEPSHSDWRAYVNRYLVPEVRQESIRFFGNADCRESQNPGLDYASPAHRLRLQSFPSHHHLFAIFDKLRLTESEIYSLCRWQGTKRAKDEFQRKHNVWIEDTTWDGVDECQHREPTLTILWDGSSAPATSYPLQCNDEMTRHANYASMQRSEPPAVTVNGQLAARADEAIGDDMDDTSITVDEEELVGDDESEDELQQSVGVALNARLMAIAEANARARARGEEVTSMDAEWEQWLKEAAERGLNMPDLPRIPDFTGTTHRTSSTSGLSRADQGTSMLPEMLHQAGMRSHLRPRSASSALLQQQLDAQLTATSRHATVANLEPPQAQ